MKKTLLSILIVLLCFSFADAQIISIAKKKAGGGGTATIARESYAEYLLPDSDSTYAWTVTIPANTTAIVVTVSGYDFYSGNPLVSANLNGSQNFTVDATLDDANDCGVGIGHLFSPASTGSQTINITTSAHGYNAYLYLIFYSGTATDGLRDSDSASNASVTLTTAVGDMVVAVAFDDWDTSIDWTNATEIDEYAFYYSSGTAIAQLTADGTSETVGTAAGNNRAIAAIVLKPGSL